MLSPAQESNLTSFGDCFDHWHSSDRVLDHDSLLALQSLAEPVPVTGDITVTTQQDLILVDTSLKNITVTLPLASKGREIEVMKNAEPNMLIVKTSGTDLILGADELRAYNYGTSLRFKAIPFGWIII